jgi:rubrerythrin
MKKALDRTTKQAFYEVYSFTRKLGSKTNTKNNWLKGQCPNCGFVPDNFSETNKCPSCGSIYNSGEFDWVLSEITQQEEWQAGSAEDIEGLAELEGENLSINREVIEDRASYLFWRWLYARIKGTPAPLARDASPEMLNTVQGGKEQLYNTSVGSVDLISVQRENSDAVADVKVQWSTAMIKDQEPYHQEHNFILKMPLVQKNPYGLADHSCNSCGGPLPETDALKCSYCGSELPATVTDWQLIAAEQIDWESEYVPEDEE